MHPVQPHRSPLALNADIPVIGWEQDGALHGAVVFFNLTTAKPMDEAHAICRALQVGLPSKLGSGATVQTTTFSHIFDPSNGTNKRE